MQALSALVHEVAMMVCVFVRVCVEGVGESIFCRAPAFIHNLKSPKISVLVQFWRAGGINLGWHHGI